MQLESEKVHCTVSPEVVYDFLTESFNNYHEIMPDDVEHFEFDDSSFVFGMKGVPHIRLVSKEKIPHERIVLTAASSKLDFDLALHLDKAPNGTDAWFSFEGDFNPMMQMMIKKPLQTFIDKLIQKISLRFNS
jgi:hypothetical protein